MAAPYEIYKSIGLPSATKSRFEQMPVERAFGRNRFHPYTSDVINRQRNAYESYFTYAYYPEIFHTVPMPSEQFSSSLGSFNNATGSSFLTQIQQFYNEDQQTTYQWAFTPKTIQNLYQLNADEGTSQNTLSAPVKYKSHPFYTRKRVEPAEGMTRTRDMYRVVYTEKQRRGLEKEYNTNKFITTEIRAKISKDLGLSARQIKIWFQNRRAKERRDSRKDKITEQPENSSVEKDDGANKHSPSTLDDTNQFLTSCRFSGSENVRKEMCLNSGQCRFSNHIETYGIGSESDLSSSSFSFASLDKIPSVSPPQWRMTTGSSFIPPIDVSPLTGVVHFGKELRL